MDDVRVKNILIVNHILRPLKPHSARVDMLTRATLLDRIHGREFIFSKNRLASADDVNRVETGVRMRTNMIDAFAHSLLSFAHVRCRTYQKKRLSTRPKSTYFAGMLYHAMCRDS